MELFFYRLAMGPFKVFIFFLGVFSFPIVYDFERAIDKESGRFGTSRFVTKRSRFDT